MAPSSSERYDVLVVGAGPAGLAAAAAARSVPGVRVAVVDAGDRPGGQYWRQPAGGGADPRLQHDPASYRRLVSGSAAADWYLGHSVWTISRSGTGFEVHATTGPTHGQVAVTLAASRLVLAPGAYDRQLPFPGWDLPGVMTAGGVQALLTGHGVVAGPRVVVAGTGPFLLPVAAGLARGGAAVLGVHEAGSGTGWLREPRTLARSGAKLVEGIEHAGVLARRRVRVRTRSTVVAAHGADALEAVTVARLDRDGAIVPASARTIATDVLAVGWGFTPQLELPLAVGCATRVDVDGSWVCVVDEEQRSSVEGVYVAGEACGVGGAALAVAEGEVAGAAAAGSRAGAGPRRRRAHGRRFAALIHRAHPVPARWPERVTDDTLVCRCEEVTAGALHTAVDDLGATDARTAKLLVRVGMGWCQGRVCGYAAACLVAARAGTEPGAPLAGRPVAAPISLGSLAEGPG